MVLALVLVFFTVKKLKNEKTDYSYFSIDSGNGL